MNEGSFYFEFRPQQWPPITPQRIEKIEQAGSIADLVCFPDGHIALILEFEGRRKEQHFQRVHIQDGGIVKFVVSWGPAGLRAAAGGAMLSTLEESGGTILDLKIKGKASYEMGSRSISTESMSTLSRDEWLFLQTLGDITKKVTIGSRYGLVRLSALLRQLLCDGTPLARLVNRKFKLNLFFEVAIKDEKSIPDSYAPSTNWRSLYPDTREEVVSVDLDRFLRLRTITHMGVDCTVGDVIAVVANAFGGVHRGKPRSNEDQVLDVLTNEILLNDESLVLHSLQDIGKVTLKALMPLGDEIVRLNAANSSSSAPAQSGSH